MMEQTLYKVKDLYVAAYLYAQQKHLLKTIREDRICWFLFSDKQGCEQLSNDYWSHTASVDPKALTDAIRTLKDLIHSQ